MENDIALMKLSSKIEYNEHVSPICLSNPQAPLPDKYITTGWGYTLS